MKLYRAWLKVDDFQCCDYFYDGVIVDLFRDGGKTYTKEEYGSMIKNYGKVEPWGEETYIDELFTLEEIKEIYKYFKRYNRTTIHHEEESLPIENNLMPLGMIPCGGGTEPIWFSEHKSYSLSFNVRGIYTLTCEDDLKKKKYPRDTRGKIGVKYRDIKRAWRIIWPKSEVKP